MKDHKICLNCGTRYLQDSLGSEGAFCSIICKEKEAYLKIDSKEIVVPLTPPAPLTNPPDFTQGFENLQGALRSLTTEIVSQLEKFSNKEVIVQYPPLESFLTPLLTKLEECTQLYAQSVEMFKNLSIPKVEVAPIEVRMPTEQLAASSASLTDHMTQSVEAFNAHFEQFIRQLEARLTTFNQGVQDQETSWEDNRVEQLAIFRKTIGSLVEQVQTNLTKSNEGVESFSTKLVATQVKFNNELLKGLKNLIDAPKMFPPFPIAQDPVNVRSAPTLENILTNILNVRPSGQQTMASSAPVVIASNQTAIPVSLASDQIVVDVAINVSGQQIATNSLGVVLASNSPILPVSVTVSGQQTRTNSLSVTMASDQPAIPIAFSSQSVVVNVGISGILNTSGQHTMAQSFPVVLANDQNVLPVSVTISGQKTMANSLGVVIASDQSAFPVTATLATSSGQQPSASSQPVVIASNQNILPVSVAVSGQTTMANSLSVAIASNQSAFPVTATLASSSGQQPAASSQPVVIASNQNILPVSVTISGQQVMASSLSVALASNQPAFPIIVITSGQQAMAASIPVVIASNQSSFPVTATLSSSSGQQPAASSQPVVIASNQNILPVSITVSGQQAMASSVSVAIASNQSPLLIIPPSGQATMASSVPVVIASNQTAFPVTATLASSSGQQPAASSQPVVIASNQNILPVSITISGQQTKANSLSVTLASDQSQILVGINSGLFIAQVNSGVPLARAVMAGVSTGIPLVEDIFVQGNSADGVTIQSSGILSSQAYNYVFNGSTWDRIPGDKAGGVRTTILGGPAIALTPSGQQTMANSTPVVIASNQSALQLVLVSGQQPKANSLSVILATDQNPVAFGIGSGVFIAQTNSGVPWGRAVMGGISIGNNLTVQDIFVQSSSADAVATQTSGILSSQAFNYVYNGVTWDRLAGDKAGGVRATILSHPAIGITPSGQLPASGSFSVTLASDQKLTVAIIPSGQQTMINSMPVTLASNQPNLNVVIISGNIGGSAPVRTLASGMPGIEGMVVMTSGTPFPSYPSGTIVPAMADKFGRTIVRNYSPREMIIQGSGIFSTSAEATILASQGVGIFVDITAIIVANQGSTPAVVRFRDITAGTTRFTLTCPASGTIPLFPQIPITMDQANNNWTAQVVPYGGLAIPALTYVWMQGIKDQ